MDIFAGHKIIGKNFWKIMQMKISELVKYSFNLYKFSIFKSFKIGSVWSEYDLKVINLTIFF